MDGGMEEPGMVEGWMDGGTIDDGRMEEPWVVDGWMEEP